MIYPILGFITGLLLGITLVLNNKASPQDIQNKIKSITKPKTKGFIIGEDNMDHTLKILEVKQKDNE